MVQHDHGLCETSCYFIDEFSASRGIPTIGYDPAQVLQDVTEKLMVELIVEDAEDKISSQQVKDLLSGRPLWG